MPASNTSRAGDATLGAANIENKMETILTRILHKDILGSRKKCTKEDDMKTHLEKTNEYIKTYLRNRKPRCKKLLFCSILYVKK